MHWSEYDKNIWHPFTQHAIEKDRIAISYGKDALLFDVDGNSYIDAISSWWVNLFGHANSTISTAIAHQAQNLEHTIFAGFTHEPACRLAQQLLEILPKNFNQVFYSDNGSTSVEVALKMALQFWFNQDKKKTKIIAFENAYHGDTFGAMSVGKSSFFAAFEDCLFDVIKIPIPNKENIDDVAHRFLNYVRNDDVACFIFEPLVQGSAGMQMYDSSTLDQLISIARQHQVLCIADEVMTGFGRTGRNFAIDYLTENVDIICLSKGITGGFLPLGVTVCTNSIYDAFLSQDKMKTFFHGHSYTANPISCAAANASLQLLKLHTTKLAELCIWQSEFLEKLSSNAKIKNIRQQGTIVAFEVAEQHGNYFSSLRDVLYQKFIAHGVLLRPLGNTVYILPPYCITYYQLEKIYTVILKVIDEI
jgi:adenosylmethionine-8-amino-7-oxononanoate aminotransferase